MNCFSFSRSFRLLKGNMPTKLMKIHLPACFSFLGIHLFRRWLSLPHTHTHQTSGLSTSKCQTTYPWMPNTKVYWRWLFIPSLFFYLFFFTKQLFCAEILDSISSSRCFDVVLPYGKCSTFWYCVTINFIFVWSHRLCRDPMCPAHGTVTAFKQPE